MSKNFRGRLATYIKQYPNDEFVVLTESVWTGKGFVNFAVYSATRTGTVLERYSRDRDAWRALRNLGYVREGKRWRKAPAQDSAPPRPELLHPIDEEVH